MKKIFTAALAASVLAVSGVAIARYAQDNTRENTISADRFGNVSETVGHSASAATAQKKGDVTARKADAKNPSAKGTNGVMIFRSAQAQGVIGIPEGRVSDNPEDNIFEVSLSGSPREASRAWIVYEVRGVAPDGVARSINDRPSIGGYLLSRTDSWTAVREEISPEWLQSGRNTVLFSIPSDADCAYTVRNVRIETVEGQAKPANTDAIVLSSLPTERGGKTYIHGFVKGAVSAVKADGETIALNGNEFEGLVPVRDGRLHITATLSSDKLEKVIYNPQNEMFAA